MASLGSEFQPNFVLWPVNNNRTGWQPVSLPVILAVPYVRTTDGLPVASSQVSEVVYFVEDAPGRAKVAGHDHVGIFVPALERFRKSISAQELANVKIDVTGLRFFDQDTGAEKTYEDARDGDTMEYGQLRGQSGWKVAGPGTLDRVEYFSHADYYDLSPFIIETSDLPINHYNFVWQCRYHPRVLSPDNEFVCLDTTQLVLARLAFNINHPGEIHQAMVSNTPEIYVEAGGRHNDPTVAFYKPFADALQDIFDEQELLKGINWIDNIPAQLIPYLAYLIGWDLPYFPGSTDEIRRSILRNGRRLQQLKGSRRAIRELFEIFGFVIDIGNLWYSKDGTRFIGSGEQLPDQLTDQEITTEVICHSEPILANYTTAGFGQLEIPLLFRPTGNITLDAWLVTDDSATATALQAAVDATASDIEAFAVENCGTTLDGYQISNALINSIPTSPILGKARILVDLDTGKGTVETLTGNEPPVNKIGVSYDSSKNILKLTFDHYLSFDHGQTLYAFATYNREKVVLPTDLANLRSNRFDINILLFKNGEQPSSDIYEFLLTFLTKFKAFHSLLRKITFTVELGAIYNVTDLCLGGRQAQSANSDLGNLQVLPPVIPTDDTVADACDVSAIQRGFKDSDLEYRKQIKKLLEEEHQSWKDLDDSHQVDSSQLPLLQALSRLQINQPDGDDCQFTQLGQDRVIRNDLDYDHNTDERTKLCDLTGNTQDYCYKGRVGQEIVIDRELIIEEIFRIKPCTLMAGNGVFYLAPLVPEGELAGGGATGVADLRDVKHINRSAHDRGYVQLMGFENAQLHYTNRTYLDSPEDALLNRYFATRKPSLEIEKDNMFMPGHRFIKMVNLASDLTHPTYFLRPWDPPFDIACPEDLPAPLPEINARLEIMTDGDEDVVFDVLPLVYYGNGGAADIPSMGDHTVSAIVSTMVTHSIWSSAAPGPGFILSDGSVTYVIDHTDGTLRFPLESLGAEKDTICLSSELPPIFRSANTTCECPEGDNVYSAQDLEDIEATGTGVTDITANATVDALTGVDYIDGYPAEYGQFTVDISDYDFLRGGQEGYGASIYGTSLYGAEEGDQLNTELATGIGIPFSTTDTIKHLFFRLGSGIRLVQNDLEYRYYDPLRLDCGCAHYGCVESEVDEVTGATEATAGELVGGGFGMGGFGEVNFGGLPGDEDVTGSGSETETSSIDRCMIDRFVQNGRYDFEPDKIEIVRKMILEEKVGTFDYAMDGSIPNMLSLDKILAQPYGGTGTEGLMPEEGSFKFIDDYGIIHSGMFETFDNRMDITVQTKDPRVWEREPTGEVIRFRTFRDGIITTCRHIIEISTVGYTVIAEGCTQEISRFQTTFGCGDETIPGDPFAFHLDAAVADDLDIVVTNVITGTSTDIDG
jgi:phage tail P2-like protein